MGLIRFILVSGFVVWHTSPIFNFSPVSGDLAIYCFYIISGFYMTLILNEKYVGKNSSRLFYFNRGIRIYPLYWVSLLLSVIWGICLFDKGHPGFFSGYVKAWPLPISTLGYLIIVNAILIGLDSVFFFGIKKTGGLFFTKDFQNTNPRLYSFVLNPMAWTVGLEILFYLMAPFIVRKKLKYLILVFMLSLALRVVLAFNGMKYAPWNLMFFPTQIMFFMLGGISYHIYLKVKKEGLNKSGALLLNVLYVLYICSYCKLFPDSSYQQGLLLVSTVIVIPIIFIRTQKSKIDKFFSDISYPVYIFQYLISSVTMHHFFPKIGGWGFTTLLTLVFFSIIVNKIITDPLEKVKINRLSAFKEAETKQKATVALRFSS